MCDCARCRLGIPHNAPTASIEQRAIQLVSDQASTIAAQAQRIAELTAQHERAMRGDLTYQERWNHDEALRRKAQRIADLEGALRSIKGEMEECMCVVAGYPTSKFEKCIVCTVNEALAGGEVKGG